MTHLEQFHKHFDCDKVKHHPGKNEYRVSSLESELDRARRIIFGRQLNLEVVNNGYLATYKAFEVKEKAI